MQDDRTSERAELSIGTDKLAFIIAKAREFDASVMPAGVDAGSDPDEPGDATLPDEDAEDPTLAELTAALDALNDDEIVEVIALAWVGRGDYDRADWADALDLARERHTGRSAGYLTGMPDLADCLEEGLEQLGYSSAAVEDERP